jgi:hypothetical protein
MGIGGWLHRNRSASPMETAPEMLSDRAFVVDNASLQSRAKHGRARASNHHDWLPHIKDGRQTQARRFRDLVRAFISDAGGKDNCSEVKLGLVRRLAATSVLIEDVEAKAVNGEPVDVGTFCQLASTALRLATRLGVERVPKPLNNEVTLADLMREAAEAVSGEAFQKVPEGRGPRTRPRGAPVALPLPNGISDDHPCT